jgi:hypothetical protein
VNLGWSEGDVLEVLLLIDGEGFDAVDVEDIVGLVLAAMIVTELSKRKRNANNDDNALLSVNSCPGTGLASFLGFFPFRPRCS